MARHEWRRPEQALRVSHSNRYDSSLEPGDNPALVDGCHIAQDKNRSPFLQDRWPGPGLRQRHSCWRLASQAAICLTLIRRLAAGPRLASSSECTLTSSSRCGECRYPTRNANVKNEICAPTSAAPLLASSGGHLGSILHDVAQACHFATRVPWHGHSVLPP